MDPGAEGEWLGADGWTARGVYSDGPRRLTRRPGAAKVEIFSRDIHAAVHVQLQNKLYACYYDCRINDARQFTEALAHYPESVNRLLCAKRDFFVTSVSPLLGYNGPPLRPQSNKTSAQK